MPLVLFLASTIMLWGGGGPREFATLDELLKASPGCTSVSDQCTICAIDGDRRTCSGIGIACLRQGWVCTSGR